MKAYGAPWNTPLTTRPLHYILYSKGKKKGLVSKLYSLFQDNSNKALPVVNLWSNDLKLYSADESLNWDKIWSLIVCASKIQTINRFILITFIGPLRERVTSRNIHHLQTAPSAQTELKVFTCICTGNAKM